MFYSSILRILHVKFHVIYSNYNHYLIAEDTYSDFRKFIFYYFYTTFFNYKIFFSQKLFFFVNYKQMFQSNKHRKISFKSQKMENIF